MTKNLSSTDSRIDTDDKNVVKFRKAYKSFVTKNDACIVLRNLNMTVPKGVIYALVGSSSCGKTTLLNCIIGRRKLDSGELCVLKYGRAVNKPRIGFMPQQTALYPEFSIWESMRHFGWLIGMSNDTIMDKVNFLVELLQLPDINEKIKCLDDGNKKLVSFAIVLLLEPELLILDEPTEGLDPLLRDAFWKNLKQLTIETKATVIFTTHYIDEVMDADIVGFMRKGRLMVEDKPTVVMSRFQAETLECAFWELSTLQDMAKGPNNRTAFQNFSLETDYCARYIVGDYLTDKKRHHWKVLVVKNFLWIFRNWSLLLTVIGIPLVVCVFFFVCFGHAPRGLNVAFVNYEDQDNCVLMQCNSTALGCHYLRYLNGNVVNLIEHDSEDSAMESVLHGTTYASIVIRQNYSAELKLRLNNWQDATNSNMLASTVDVFRDTSKAPVTVFLTMFLEETFTRFITDFLKECSIKRSQVLYPLQWKTSLYSLLQVDFGDFACPGILLTTILLVPAGLAATTMLMEKNEGTFDRCVSLGVCPLEFLYSHVITDFVVAFSICISTFCATAYIFGIAIKGSYAILALLIVLTCFCGLWLGYLLANVCRSAARILYITLGSLFPLTCLCGILWPIEGMVPALQYIAYALPLTLPSETLRSILKNNWKMSRPTIYLGFVAITAWTAVFALLCILITRRVK